MNNRVINAEFVMHEQLPAVPDIFSYDDQRLFSADAINNGSTWADVRRYLICLGYHANNQSHLGRASYQDWNHTLLQIKPVKTKSTEELKALNVEHGIMLQEGINYLKQTANFENLHPVFLAIKESDDAFSFCSNNTAPRLSQYKSFEAWRAIGRPRKTSIDMQHEAVKCALKISRFMKNYPHQINDSSAQSDIGKIYTQYVMVMGQAQEYLPLVGNILTARINLIACAWLGLSPQQQASLEQAISVTTPESINLERASTRRASSNYQQYKPAIGLSATGFVGLVVAAVWQGVAAQSLAFSSAITLGPSLIMLVGACMLSLGIGLAFRVACRSHVRHVAYRTVPETRSSFDNSDPLLGKGVKGVFRSNETALEAASSTTLRRV